MAKTQLKEQALELRKGGKSIKTISSILKVSPSTASVWCRDIALSDRAIKAIAKNGKENSIIGLMRYSERKREERKRAEVLQFTSGKKRLGKLKERDIYCIGLGLYWGEGYKTGNQEFGFSNSDSRMILFYLKWLKTTFDISKTQLILRVSINESHRRRISEVENYWSKITGVPLSQFTKPSLIKTASKKIYANESVHMGTLRIKVRNGTTMRREVIGAIKSIS
jgi:hypothetical protein